MLKDQKELLAALNAHGVEYAALAAFGAPVAAMAPADSCDSPDMMNSER